MTVRILQAIVLMATLFVRSACSQEAEPGQPAAPPATRFEAIEVYLDSGDAPLAAYQFEFAAETGEIKIVGIEGGEHPAFKEPPYYDPAALSKGRVVIAAFNTGDDLPKGKTLVARLHVAVTGEVKPEYVVKLDVAASTEGKKIPSTATLAEGERT